MQEKLATLECQKSEEVRELLSKNRKLYLRAGEMRKEFQRISAENRELLIEVARRDSMLADGKILMSEMQSRLLDHRLPTTSDETILSDASNETKASNTSSQTNIARLGSQVTHKGNSQFRK
ncbi:MAG: hypothetical protein SGPRY_004023, partial [Prymnesium sp.]